MRSASLGAIINLPITVDDLRKKAGGINLARNFVTLANIASCSKELSRLTAESRWSELYNWVNDIMARSTENRKVVEH